MKDIDSLPVKLPWIYDKITVTGDVVGDKGLYESETLDLWRRDPIECIKELLSDPRFRELLVYAPERVYRDESRRQRLIDEMWTADWWWMLQVSITMTSRRRRCLPSIGSASSWGDHKPCHTRLGQDATLEFPWRPVSLARVPHDRQPSKGNTS